MDVFEANALNTYSLWIDDDNMLLIFTLYLDENTNIKTTCLNIRDRIKTFEHPVFWVYQKIHKKAHIPTSSIPTLSGLCVIY